MLKLFTQVPPHSSDMKVRLHVLDMLVRNLQWLRYCLQTSDQVSATEGLKSSQVKEQLNKSLTQEFQTKNFVWNRKIWWPSSEWKDSMEVLLKRRMHKLFESPDATELMLFRWNGSHLWEWLLQVQPDGVVFVLDILLPNSYRVYHIFLLTSFFLSITIFAASREHCFIEDSNILDAFMPVVHVLHPQNDTIPSDLHGFRYAVDCALNHWEAIGRRIIRPLPRNYKHFPLSRT